MGPLLGMRRPGAWIHGLFILAADEVMGPGPAKAECRQMDAANDTDLAYGSLAPETASYPLFLPLGCAHAHLLGLHLSGGALTFSIPPLAGGDFRHRRRSQNLLTSRQRPRFGESLG